MFRYELSNILRKHLNEDEKQSNVFGGRNPLSKIAGRALKDVFNQKDPTFQDKYLEMYRPPGIIHNQKALFDRSELPHKEKLWFCNPSNQIYVRETKEMPAIRSKDLND